MFIHLYQKGYVFHQDLFCWTQHRNPMNFYVTQYFEPFEIHELDHLCELQVLLGYE